MKLKSRTYGMVSVLTDIYA